LIPVLRLLYGPTYFQLSSGYETSGPAPTTVGLTAEVTLYLGGNPLTYSVVSGPSTLSIDPKSGVVAYTPAAGDVGAVSATLEASNSLGSVTQTIRFAVAAYPNFPKPTLQVSGTTATYNGHIQQVTAMAVGTDGVTPVGGTFQYASNGSSTLTVVPLAKPKVTLNPSNATVTAGDPVSFTAAATGSPTITVQWQVSTDGGKTWTNITGNASATTTTLTFYAGAAQNGYKYRAVFTNSAGSTTTLFATLTVESDSGGGGGD
jgi:hypothetical protein